MEILSGFEAAFLLQDGATDFLRHPGIHSAFVAHDGPRAQVLPYDPAGGLHRSQIRHPVFAHWSRHSHYDEGSILQPPGIPGEFQGGGGHRFISCLPGRVHPLPVQGQFGLIDIEPDYRKMLGKGQGQGQTHIPQTHHSDCGISVSFSH